MQRAASRYAMPMVTLLGCLIVGCASTPGRDRALDPVMQMDFCPDGRSLVVSTTRSEIAWFDAHPLHFRELLSQSTTRLSLANLLRSPPVVCSPGSRLVVAAGLEGKLVGWDLDTRLVRFSLPAEDGIRDLAFLPDGGSFITVGGRVRRHSSQTGLVLDEIAMPTEAMAMAVAISADGRTMLVGLSNGRILDIDIDSHQLVRTLEGHSAPVTDIAFSPDGNSFASTAGRFDPRIWNRGESEPMPKRFLDTANVKEVLGKAQRSTDALMLFTWLLGTARGFVLVGAPTLGASPPLINEVDLAAGEAARHCEPSVAYSPDGRFLAVTANLSLLSGEYHLLLIDRQRNEGRVISGIYGCSVTFSRDGLFVATGGLGAPELWDVATGSKVK